jgi:hypothetical protein
MRTHGAYHVGEGPILHYSVRRSCGFEPIVSEHDAPVAGLVRDHKARHVHLYHARNHRVAGVRKLRMKTNCYY